MDNVETETKTSLEQLKEIEPKSNQANFEWQAPDNTNEIAVKSHAKSILLLLLFIVVGFYLITRDVVGTLVIIICLGLLFYYANLKPKLINYSIKGDNLSIGNKAFNMTDFKTYRLLKSSDEFNVVDLIPLKRFAPAATLVIPVTQVNQITDYLSGLLALDNKSLDMFDKLMSHIKF